MQSTLVLAASLVLAVGAAAGVTTYMHQRAEDTLSDATRSPDVGTRIAALEDEIARLRAGVAEAASSSPAPQRQAIDPVSDARIEAAITRWLAKNPIEASASKGKAKKNLRQTFQQLMSGVSDEDYQAVWKELRENGQADEMLAIYEESAARDPDNPEAQMQLGLAYLMRLQGMPPGVETGKFALNADKALDKALALDPEHWDARFVKAQALSFWPPMFGKQADAIKQLEVLREKQEAKATQVSKFAQTYLMLGNLYSQQGKKDKAMEAWRKGATLFPRNAQLRDKIGN